MKQALLVFVKNAVEGKVKTRLAATMGDAAALEIYQQLLRHTERCTHGLLVDKIVFYSDYLVERDMWDDSIYNKQVQSGSDLGERMENAFKYAFAQGNERVVIIGSDCFEISEEIIKNAFAQLEQCDVVIGPALDGGYYLLGIKSLYRELFCNISWSTDQVLKQTIQACHQLGLKTTKLQELSDIDKEDDLKRVLTK